jgi:hypothetical protein
MLFESVRYWFHDCSGCFRLERLPGGSHTHWKAPPFHGARVERTRNTPREPYRWSIADQAGLRQGS